MEGKLKRGFAVVMFPHYRFGISPTPITLPIYLNTEVPARQWTPRRRMLDEMTMAPSCIESRCFLYFEIHVFYVAYVCKSSA